ncbi:LysE family translocator [Calothrix sp. NIES-3974]|uniref:LysE family translocator n=1 Tax=Calothrix sp. NIES-3974 TaxID=2005462 RepID=UPI000B5E3D1F|nr:LysE family translocator [Calothrix sp. NIES-3974]BAZ06793.1 hypothetical protein NIES3974_34550 [Calothrix sp. NIES-3974]
MTFTNIVALFTVMLFLAAIPSISVLTVSTRSASLGLIHGVFTTIGIVIGDICFIILAIGGLSFLASQLASLFLILKYLGGIYLIFLGIKFWRLPALRIQTQSPDKSSLVSSLLMGLLITLGDQKATLFYLGFFPAFVDIAQITLLDTITIIAIAAVTVGGVKLTYALMADRARLLVNSQFSTIGNKIAACIMIGVGIFLVIRNS